MATEPEPEPEPDTDTDTDTDTGEQAEAPRFRTDEERWQAVLARDPAADGCFVCAVRTTGIYARPTSTARLPLRTNVAFFDDAASAEAAGYRASRRHAGDAPSAARHRSAVVVEACRQIEQAEVLPGLGALALGAGLSAFHFHRLFKGETGLTPKQYVNAFRASRLRESLGSAATVTGAMYDAGFHSNSRFYESAKAMLGMQPAQWRAGGKDAEIRFAVGQASLGAVLVAQSLRGICAILLGDDPEVLLNQLQDRFPRAVLIGCDAEFERLVAQVVGLVEAPGLGLNLPLDVQGTAFQVRVWQALGEIPPGSTASYADIARRIGSPRAVRAVAQACAANTLAIAIPCHRVVRQDGSLSGYRWGVARKQTLLLREGNPVR